MAGRVARSSQSRAEGTSESATPKPERATRVARSVRASKSYTYVDGGKQPRTAQSNALGRSSTSVTASHIGRSVTSERVSSSKPGQFVDARGLEGADHVSKTLAQAQSSVGVVVRPKVLERKERSKEQRRARIHYIATRAGIVAGVLAAVSALVWLLFFSTVFRLETSGITVEGDNQWVSHDQILAIAGKQTGKSLLLVSSGHIVQQLENIPGVTQAHVDKQLPNKLQVSVQAQKPAALLREPNGSLTAVDNQGRVLNAVSDASVEGIPVIEVANVEQGLKNRAVQEALAVVSRMPDNLRARVSSVSAATQDSITTGLDENKLTIVWGSASHIELKIAEVETILGDSNVLRDYTRVDVSAPKRPVMKK